MSKLLIIVVAIIQLFALEPISMGQVNLLNPLQKGEYLYDNHAHYTIETIDSAKMFQTSKSFLNYPKDPDANIWLRFDIVNDEQHLKELILEYRFPPMELIEVYQDGKLLYHDGIYFEPLDRLINYAFELTVAPSTTSRIYLKIASSYSSLKMDALLYEPEEFYYHESLHQAMLFLLYGGVIALFLYNLFLLFIVKERIYLYYLITVAMIILHQLIHRGVYDSFIHNIPYEMMGYYMMLMGLGTTFLYLFSYHLLKIERYPRLRALYHLLIVGLSLYTFYATFWETMIDYTMILVIMMSYVVLFMVGFYLYFIQKEQSAKYYAYGWSVVIISIIGYILYNQAIVDWYAKVPYLFDLSLLFEMLMFSLALADRINIIKDEKAKSDFALYMEQQKQKERLEAEVAQKTQTLSQALKEREVLFQELNHRVRNNLQMILSFLRLQKDDASQEVQSSFTQLENRIKSISLLHDQLYLDNDLKEFKTNEYFQSLIDNIQKGLTSKHTITTHLEIKTTIEPAQMIYCGIILNELVTNTIKHAYNEHGGAINITLDEVDGHKSLCIRDFGRGRSDQDRLGLGELIIHAIAEGELGGVVTVESYDGTKTTITF
jgi:two-component sensor histidine kinase